MGFQVRVPTGLFRSRDSREGITGYDSRPPQRGLPYRVRIVAETSVHTAHTQRGNPAFEILHLLGIQHRTKDDLTYASSIHDA